MTVTTLPATRLREPVRVRATLLRPGHLVRLEYGRALDLAVTEVHTEVHMDMPCVRTCGWLSLPGGEPYEYTTDSRHRPDGRMKVIGDRNDPAPGVGNATWHDLTRVIRAWSGRRATVWSLHDPDEPLGHGGRLRGMVRMTRRGWRWRGAYTGGTGFVAGDYLDAEAALLAATETAKEE